MAFPNDLSDVVVFKIHPAIGVARVSKNDDYYVFGTDPGDYKSNGLIKRQAVQFRVFAYGENHVALGELTPQIISDLKITAVWSAKVANRKVAKWEGTPLSGTEFVISAEASSDDANAGQLVGSLPQFEEGAAIPLGQIMPNGLFIPPKGGVYRRTQGDPVEPYPATSTKVADTSCDGSVMVRLTHCGQELPVLPACIVVAPQDFSPDTQESLTLYDWLKEELQIQITGQGTINNLTARAIDEAALKSGTPDFNPGVEVDLGSGRSEVVDLKSIFYQSALDPLVDPREIRVRYKSSPTDRGAVPGQLTSGLCSTWQGDYMACIGYWTEHLPPEAYLDEDEQTAVMVFRKQYSDTSPGAETLSTGDEIEQYIDKMGVVRFMNGKKVETERGPGDDV
jgi:L-Lysine epsilon oxidase N-terminal